MAVVLVYGMGNFHDTISVHFEEVSFSTFFSIYDCLLFSETCTELIHILESTDPYFH
jgi:hypothetical protein